MKPVSNSTCQEQDFQKTSLRDTQMTDTNFNTVQSEQLEQNTTLNRRRRQSSPQMLRIPSLTEGALTVLEGLLRKPLSVNGIRNRYETLFQNLN